jgi:hypothetical protein
MPATGDLFKNLGNLMNKKVKTNEEVKKDSIVMDSIFNKNGCYDLFQEAHVDGVFMYEPMLHRKRVQLKI